MGRRENKVLDILLVRHTNIGRVAEWQTQKSQKLPGVIPVWVRVPPCPPNKLK